MIRGGEGAGGPGSAHPNKAAAMCTRARSRCATARCAGGERREIDKPVERMILRRLGSPAPKIEVLRNLTQDLDVAKLTTTACAGPVLNDRFDGRTSHCPYSVKRMSTTPNVPKSARAMSPGRTDSKPVHVPVEITSPALRPTQRAD